MMPYRALIAPLFLAACATNATTPSREGPVAMGEQAYAGGPLVTPLTVVEDSRCPTDVNCVWAGRAVVRVAIRGHAGRESWKVERDLTLGAPEPIADGTLTLVAMTPERVAGQTIRPGDYRFTFAFKGGL